MYFFNQTVEDSFLTRSFFKRSLKKEILILKDLFYYTHWDEVLGDFSVLLANYSE